MVNYAFPIGFVWGAATASAQIEGAADADGKGLSIWDTFSKKPGAVCLGQSPQNACNHYNLWEKDVELMSKIGLQAYRFSIAWPRIYPSGTGEINQRGLSFYDKLIDGLLAKKIEPFVTLYHWDLPQDLEDKGGWRNRDTAYAYEKYVETVVKKLGDRVKYWATFNEMSCVIDLGYMTGYHAPGAKENMKTCKQVAHHVLLAHGLGIQAIRRSSKIKTNAGLVSNPAIPLPFYECDEDIDAARKCFKKVNSWLFDPIFLGKYPEDIKKEIGKDFPDVKSGDLKIINQPLDFLGINAYSGSYVIHHDKTLKFPEPFAPSTDMKWAIMEDCLYWGCRFTQEVYNPPPMYITENGCAFPDDVNESGRVDDISRVEYLKAHLKGVHRAFKEKLPVKGYFCWSLMDNFEWAWGYTKRFGIIFVNYETFERIPKLSSEWYSKTIKNNGF